MPRAAQDVPVPSRQAHRASEAQAPGRRSSTLLEPSTRPALPVAEAHLAEDLEEEVEAGRHCP